MSCDKGTKAIIDEALEAGGSPVETVIVLRVTGAEIARQLPQATLLVKGSRFMKMERVVQRLQQDQEKTTC